MRNRINKAIGLLDRLGTKGIWQREHPDDVLKFLKALFGAFDVACDGMNKKSLSITRKEIKSDVYTFSDTVLFTFEGKSEMAPDLFLSLCADLLHVVFNLSLFKNVHFRGVLTYGTFYSLPDVPSVIGPSVDEAANWFESSDWIGIHCTGSTIRELDVRKDYYALIQYSVPLKNNTVYPTFVVNWVKDLDSNSSYQKYVKDIFNIHISNHKSNDKNFNPRDIIANMFSKTVTSPEIWKKYENTLKFYDYIISQK